ECVRQLQGFLGEFHPNSCTPKLARTAKTLCLHGEERVHLLPWPVHRWDLFILEQVFIFLQRREEAFAGFQRLGGAFRSGDESTEFLHQLAIAVELVQPEKLTLFVDLQEPPLPLRVNAKIERSGADTRLPRECQHALFDLRRGGDYLRLDMA